MNEIYDLVIIGAGPAGLAAGIYAARAELKVIILEKMVSGGQIINTYEVDNYPGIPGVSGYELAVKFKEHCDKLGVKFEDGDVTGLKTTDDKYKIVELNSEKSYKTKTVLIASGAVNRKLGVKGEEELTGMGVSYCATCDGAFYKNRITAVVGGGDVAVEDAIFLARLCKKVYVIHRRDEFRAAKTLVTALNSLDNVEIIYDSVVDEIMGTDMVTGLRLHNVKNDESRELEISGAFIAVGNTPSSQAFIPQIAADSHGYIIAGEDCITNVEGIFAAGDVRTKKLRQVITAAADGANAVTSIEGYISANFY